MAGGGRVKIKGGVASKGEAEVINGALKATIVGGGGGAGSFQLDFFGENLVPAASSVDLSDGNELGVTIPRSVRTAAVAVTMRHQTTVPNSIGDWTLRLFRNGVQVATFNVDMA